MSDLGFHKAVIVKYLESIKYAGAKDNRYRGLRDAVLGNKPNTRLLSYGWDVHKHCGFNPYNQGYEHRQHVLKYRDLGGDLNELARELFGEDCISESNST